MAAMHGLHRIAAEALHAGGIILGHRMVERIVERPVIDHISRKKRARSRFPQGDASRRMTGKVQHFEVPVAEVEDIAVRHQAGRRGEWRALAEAGG